MRNYFEPRFGVDFSHVRIHDDAKSKRSARSLGATAYTLSNHIMLGEKATSLNSAAGQHIMAHELTHVVQQTKFSQPIIQRLRPEDVAIEMVGRSFHTTGQFSVALLTGGGTFYIPFQVMGGETVFGVDWSHVPAGNATVQFPAVHVHGLEPFKLPKALLLETDGSPATLPPPPLTFEGHQLQVVPALNAIQFNGGETVVVVAWSNASRTATVRLATPPGAPVSPSFDIPKTRLRPIAPTSGLAPYGADVEARVADIESQERSIERGEQRLEQERSRPGGPRPGEITRLEGLQTRREAHLTRLHERLNRRLIQETMFNRFDPIIERWVTHYNSQFGYSGSRALDPNLVKSMLFQESQMGTAGVHLEIAPSWPVRSRFNIGQAIDSSAAALLVMMQEMEPALITTFHLTNIERDRIQAQRDLRRLAARATRTPAEQARLDELRAIDNMDMSFAEDFMWEYRAPGESTGFNEAVTEFFDMGAGQPNRSVDYDFWIRTAVRWLFEKRQSVSSWREAIRAYNGSGARARRYRDAVIRRAEQAIAAQRGSLEFIPDRI